MGRGDRIDRRLAPILAAAGIEAALKNKLDGVNLLPHLEGASSQPPHKALHLVFEVCSVVHKHLQSRR